MSFENTTDPDAEERDVIGRIRRWLQARERPYFIFMPRKLRRIQAAVEAGADPDDVPGIEELWLWRFEKQSDAFEETHRKYFEWCKRNPGQF